VEGPVVARSGVNILGAAAQLPKRPGHDALRELGEQLRAYRVDEHAVESARTRDPRHVIEQHDDGPLIALRWYEPGYVSTIHSHSWTIIVGLDGSGTLERFELVNDRAKHVSTEATDAPNVCVIDGDEIHRQASGPAGALELILIGEYDLANPQMTEYDA
jgi:hypothetical protein